MIKIRPLKFNDCYAVASAHTANLNSPFKTAGGIRLLQAYYEALTKQLGGIGFVAIIDDQLAGYICGVWNRRVIRVFGLKKLHVLIFNGIRHVLAEPKYILYVLNRLIRVKMPEDPIGDESVDGYELRPIVVLPAFRGQGIAEKLVEHLLEDARKRGFDQIFLFTEHDNLAAIKFYTRFGFVLEEERELHAGTTHATTGKLFRYYFDHDEIGDQ